MHIQKNEHADKNRTSTQQHSFVQGALILSIGVILVKLLGAIYKIPLTNMIGELGMGYFNTAYQLYLPIYTIATAGFPVAISRLVSEYVTRGDWLSAREVYRKSNLFFWISGSIGTLLMVVGAQTYATFVGSPGAVWSIRVLAPTVFVCCIMSSLRGYYAGNRNMTPTAVSQVTEAVGRLVLGLLGAWIVLKKGQEQYQANGTVWGNPVSTETEALQLMLPYASAAAILGVTVGAVAGLLVLYWYDFRLRKRFTFPSKKTGSSQVRTAQIAAIALPICAGAMIVNLGAIMDATMLQNRLTHVGIRALRLVYGMLIPIELNDREVIPFLYGSFTMAQNLSALVPTIAQAIASSALPSVAAASVSGNRKQLRTAVEDVLRITALLAFPAGIGLCVMAPPILNLLYASRPLGASIAVKPLMLLAVSSVFMTLSVPVNSMLQAIGRERLPLKLMAVGFIVKLGADLFLISIPELNMTGACIGTLLCYMIVLIFGLFFLRRACPEPPNIGKCLLPSFFAATVCGGSAFLLYQLLRSRIEEKWATILSLATAIVVYVIAVILGKILHYTDVAVLPGGKKIAEYLEKHGWIR